MSFVSNSTQKFFMIYTNDSLTNDFKQMKSFKTSMNNTELITKKKKTKIDLHNFSTVFKSSNQNLLKFYKKLL